jgi:hypothetical protein
MAKQDGAVLSDLMEASPGNPHWATLLKGCLNLKWCKGDQCSASAGCQMLLGNMLNSQSDISVLKTLTSIASPTPYLLQSTLSLAQTSTTAANVLALGKVLNQFSKNNNGDGSQAQNFLEGLVSAGCNSDSDDTLVLVAAIKSLAPLPSNNMEQFVSCLQASVGDSAKFALVQAINAQDSISNTETRSALMAVLADNSRTVKLRIACFVGLIMSDPSAQEVNAIVQLATDASQPMLFRHCLKTFLSGQVALKDTKYKALPDSTIGLIEGTGAFSEESTTLKKHNFKTSQTVTIPKVGQQADVDINLDVFTAGDSIVPTIADLTVTAETPGFGRREVIQLRIDGGRMLAVINGLLESDEYIKSDAFKHLLKLPMKQMVSYLFQNQGFLSDAVMNNLQLLHEKFSLVEEMNSMDRVPFFDLKILGQRLTGARFARNGSPGFSVVNALEMMKSNENGYEFSNMYSSVPLVYQQAVPTSIGTPLVTYLRLNSAAKTAGYWLMEATKMYLTGNGDTHGSYDIKVDLDATLGQTSSIMREVGCGSAIKAEIEVVDSGESKLETTSTSATFSMKLPEKSAITFRLQDVATPWASISGNAVKLADEECANVINKNLYGMVQVHVCMGKRFPREGVVGYQTDGSSWVANLDWAPRGTVQGFVFDVKQVTKISSVATVTKTWFEMNSDYKEADRELTFDAIFNNNPSKSVGFKSVVTENNEDGEESTSFDLAIDAKGKQIIETTFTITKSEAEDESDNSWGWGSWGWGSSDEEEEEESSGAPNYKFSGYMTYMEESELGFTGNMESPDANGEFQANLQVTATGYTLLELSGKTKTLLLADKQEQMCLSLSKTFSVLKRLAIPPLECTWSESLVMT